MAEQYVLTCGSCQGSHALTGGPAVMAAEIATFLASHRGHDNSTISANPAPGGAEPGNA